MTDFLETKIAEIRERLAEIRPLVDEANRLEGALAVLNAEEPDSIPEEAGIHADPSIARPRKPTTRKTRAPRGQNRDKAIAAIQERPGVSASELASIVGVSRPVMYTLLSRLKGDGIIRAENLPSGVSGYSMLPLESVTLAVTTGGPPPVKKDSEVAYVTQEGT